MYSTDDILLWVKRERQYQRSIRKPAKSLLDEIEYAQGLLDHARQSYDPQASSFRQRAVMMSFRRIAANLIRSIEKYGMPDQDMQPPLPEERENDQEKVEKYRQARRSEAVPGS